MVDMVLEKKIPACCISTGHNYRTGVSGRHSKSEMNISCKPLIDLLMKSRHKIKWPNNLCIY